MNIRAFTQEDYRAVVAVRNAATPKDPISDKSLQERDIHTHPALRRGRWLAECDGRVVGVGEYTQSTDLYHPRKFQLIVHVHPGHQRRGIGSALYEHLVRELRAFEPIAFQARAHEDDGNSLCFLAKRGFVEDFRQWESHLDLDGFDLAPWREVEGRVRALGIGIASLPELAGDPDRDRRLYELERETDADIPSPESIRASLWPRDESRFERYADLVLNDPDRPPWTYLVAVKGGRYVGLNYGDADPDHGTFDIDMTGVKRAYRGFGIATALKVRGIAHAKQHGYRAMRTWNDTANQPILALNAKLGFVRQPALIFFETPTLFG